MSETTNSVPPLGCGLLLTVQSVGSRVRRFVSLLAHCEPEYMVLRRSQSHPGDLPALRLQLGDRLRVRFLESGTAYGFEVRVLRILQEPELLVFTSFPESAAARSVRRAERVSCMLPCLVSSGEGGSEVGLLLDISAHGCQLALPGEHPPPELEVERALSLTLPGDDEPVRVNATVRRVQPRGAGHRIGLEFGAEQHTLVEAVRRLTAMLQ